MLTGLLQAVVHWAHPLQDLHQEHTDGVWEQQEHLVTWLELPGLRWLVVGPLLFTLGGLHVFGNNGGDPVNPILPLLDVVNQ